MCRFSSVPRRWSSRREIFRIQSRTRTRPDRSGGHCSLLPPGWIFSDYGRSREASNPATPRCRTKKDQRSKADSIFSEKEAPLPMAAEQVRSAVVGSAWFLGLGNGAKSRSQFSLFLTQHFCQQPDHRLRGLLAGFQNLVMIQDRRGDTGGPVRQAGKPRHGQAE